MVTKKKVDLAAVLRSLETVCTKCGYHIRPAEMRRADFESIKCSSVW